jgi:hypothetical protein
MLVGIKVGGADQNSCTAKLGGTAGNEASLPSLHWDGSFLFEKQGSIFLFVTRRTNIEE